MYVFLPRWFCVLFGHVNEPIISNYETYLICRRCDRVFHAKGCQDCEKTVRVAKEIIEKMKKRY